MNYTVFNTVARGIKARKAAKHVEICDDGSLKSPSMQKAIDEESSHGPNTKHVGYMTATKMADGWQLHTVKEEHQIMDSLSGEDELDAYRVIGRQAVGFAKTQQDVAIAFYDFNQAQQKDGYSPAKKTNLDQIVLPPTKPSAEIIRPNFA